MILAIPKESYLEEKRVAIAPENVPAFLKLGYEVRIQSGAGKAAQMSDSSYQQEELKSLTKWINFGLPQI